ncbi:unnamed protein product [Arctogadus glacialis]
MVSFICNLIQTPRQLQIGTLTLKQSKPMDTRVLLMLVLSGPLTDKLYHLVQLKPTWEAARDHCQLYDLAVIESAEENEEVLSTLTTSAWIGLYREPWVLSDGCKDVLIYWSPEPEEPPELEITPESETHLPRGPTSKIEEPTDDNLASGGLSDHDCEDVHPFICNRGFQPVGLDP